MGLTVLWRVAGTRELSYIILVQCAPPDLDARSRSDSSPHAPRIDAEQGSSATFISSDESSGSPRPPRDIPLDDLFPFQAAVAFRTLVRPSRVGAYAIDA